MANNFVDPQFSSNPLLKTHFQNTPIHIATQPINSSGDIYHTLSWVFFCRAMNWHVPLVCLSYDCRNVETHVDRAMAFVNTLTVSNNFEKHWLFTTSKHFNTRSSTLRKKMIEKSVNSIDQKMTTALLSQAMRIYGKDYVIEKIRKGFLDFSKVKDKNVLKPIITWALERCAFIEAAANGKPIVVINHRNSNAANGDLSLNHDELKKLTKYLRKKGFYVHLLIVGSCSTEDYNLFNHGGKKNYTEAFDETVTANSNFEKLQHLILIDQMLNLSNIFGMIGGTSGTLDIAALLGWNVHCIHRFKNNFPILNCQGYRLLLQNEFMSIGHPVSKIKISLDKNNKFKEVYNSIGVSALQCWIDTNGKRQFPSINHVLATTIDHVARDPFHYANIGDVTKVPTNRRLRTDKDYEISNYSNHSDQDLALLKTKKAYAAKMAIWERAHYKKSSQHSTESLFAQLSITNTRRQRSQDDCLNKTNTNRNKPKIIPGRSFTI